MVPSLEDRGDTTNSEDEEDENPPKGTIVKSSEMELHDRGSGVSSYFGAEDVERYGLEVDESMEVREILSEDGRLFLLTELPNGIRVGELDEFADENGWETVEEEGEWEKTYLGPEELVEIVVDPPTKAGESFLNNIFIKGKTIEIDSEEVACYSERVETAEEENLNIRIQDSEGLWQRLKKSAQRDTEDVPDEEVLERLVEKSDWVSFQFSNEIASPLSELEDLEESVEAVRSATRNLLQ
jgi:hypothetical protein